jgi:acyl-CoA thioesterase I
MRVLVFGDSICAGSNIPDGDASHAWPVLFGAASGYTIINRSRGGRPTAARDEFVAAWEDVLIAGTATPPDALIIALGTNDSRDLDAGMVDRAVANIDVMVVQAQTGGTGRIVIVGPYNIDPEALRQSYGIRVERERNLRMLGAAYEAYAVRAGIAFLSLYGCIPPASLCIDGVHPDRAGNAAIADFALPRLRELLER